MIKTKFIRNLDLLSPIDTSEHSFISSASGLQKIGDTFYTIADDECHLIMIPQIPTQKCSTDPLIDRKLPKDQISRKKIKPDFESLAHFSAKKLFTGDTLLAVPSGSKPNRTIGVAIDLKTSEKYPIDFSDLYLNLIKNYEPLNIEGSLVAESKFYLFNRGNTALAQNFIVELDLTKVVKDILQQKKITSSSIVRVTPVNLGIEQGYSIAFTDASLDLTSDNKIYFCAAVEATENTYDDGSFLGAYIGYLDSNLKVKQLLKLDIPYKPEGLWVNNERFYVVTDADDPNTPSMLFEGSLSQ